MEYLQGFVPGRVVSLWDIAANTSGVLIGLLFDKVLRRIKL